MTSEPFDSKALPGETPPMTSAGRHARSLRWDEAHRLIDAARRRAEQIAVEAAREASAPAALLGRYVEVVLDTARAGRRVGRGDLTRFRRTGEIAAEQGAPLPALIDLYLSATWRIWQAMAEHAGDVAPSAVAGAAAALFRASDDVAAALAGGYQDAQRIAIRHQEAARQEFIDGLLSGGSASLARRADDFGFNRSASHVVVVARPMGETNGTGAGLGRLEYRVQARFADRGAVAATREGFLVCVFPSASDDPDPAIQLADLLAALGSERWRLGVGTQGPGLAAVARSYREAREALDLGDRLGLADPIVRTEAVRPFRLLSRDPAELDGVVREVLGGLDRARGGPEHLLATLEAFFAEGGNVSGTARRLHLTPRAVSYRLRTIRELTGYRTGDARDAFVLQMALWGRRMRRGS